MDRFNYGTLPEDRPRYRDLGAIENHEQDVETLDRAIAIVNTAATAIEALRSRLNEGAREADIDEAAQYLRDAIGDCLKPARELASTAADEAGRK